jgi:hypothetical protein
MAGSKVVQREKSRITSIEIITLNFEEAHTLMSPPCLTRHNFTFLRQRRNTNKGEREVYHPACSLERTTWGLLLIRPTFKEIQNKNNRRPVWYIKVCLTQI